MAAKIMLNTDQRKALEALWFEWGNYGPKTSMPNHKFIQGLLEHQQDYRNFYKPDPNLIILVDAVLTKTPGKVF